MDLFDGPFFRREFARLNERMDRLELKLDRIADALGMASTVPAPEVEPIVRELLRAGHKLQAVKAYQQSAGVDLSTVTCPDSTLASAHANTCKGHPWA